MLGSSCCRAQQPTGGSGEGAPCPPPLPCHQIHFTPRATFSLPCVKDFNLELGPAGETPPPLRQPSRDQTLRTAQQPWCEDDAAAGHADARTHLLMGMRHLRSSPAGSRPSSSRFVKQTLFMSVTSSMVESVTEIRRG